MKAPSGTVEAEVPVPSHTGPVKFQTLDLKFRRGIFEIVARSGILFPVEKPMHGINIHANINRVRLEALGLR